MQDQSDMLGHLEVKRLFPLTPEMVRRLLDRQDHASETSPPLSLDRDAAR